MSSVVPLGRLAMVGDELVLENRHEGRGHGQQALSEELVLQSGEGKVKSRGMNY